MIRLGEQHICHRRLGKTRHVATWSVVSVCLTSVWQTWGNTEADVSETGGRNGAVISPARWMEDLQGSGTDVSLHFLCTSTTHPLHWLFLLSKSVFIASSTQTESFTKYSIPLYSFSNPDDYLVCHPLVVVQWKQPCIKTTQRWLGHIASGNGDKMKFGPGSPAGKTDYCISHIRCRNTVLWNRKGNYHDFKLNIRNTVVTLQRNLCKLACIWLVRTEPFQMRLHCRQKSSSVPLCWHAHQAAGLA